MKKYITIAALLAAGTTFANADVNATQNEDKGWTLVGTGAEIDTAFKTILAGSTYVAGDAFEISFEVTGHTAINGYVTTDLVQLADSYYLMTQAGNYLGLSASNTALSNGTTDPGANTTGVFDENGVYKITSESLVYGWVSVNADKGSAAYGIDGLKVTLGTDGTDSYISLNFDGNEEKDTYVTLEGIVFDANDVVLNNRADGENAYISAATFTTTIPEPSAFGLLAGVGALALVASRRRRR